MDQLFAAALEEIALEGRCSLSALLCLLSPTCQQLRLPLPLDSAFSQLLFSRLLRCPSLSLLSHPPLSGFAPLEESVLDGYGVGGGGGEEGGSGGGGGVGVGKALTEAAAERGEDECGDEVMRGKKQSQKKKSGKEKAVRFRWVGCGGVRGEGGEGGAGSVRNEGQGKKEKAEKRRAAGGRGGGGGGGGGTGGGGGGEEEEWGWERAEREGVVVVAHKGLRLASLGVYEESEFECEE
ncbi:unnamed protein product [Closterium sp. Naga37s-1]|nr:unnamed protein product [Closterium sp. Naga37s-1]